MFISEAYAQTPDAVGGFFAGAGSFQQFIPLIGIAFIFYFLLIRPQQKRMKEHKAMLLAVRRGDKVVTSGGVVGTVVKVVSDGELLVEIAENVRVRVMRDTLAAVLTAESKTPANDKGKPRDKDKGAPAPDDESKTEDDSSSSDASSKLKNLLTKK